MTETFQPQYWLLVVSLVAIVLLLRPQILELIIGLVVIVIAAVFYFFVFTISVFVLVGSLVGELIFSSGDES